MVVEQRWRYGDAGDRIPVRDGDRWRVGDHDFICADIVRDRSALAPSIGSADMVYVDPPWSAGNARAFRTKAGLTGPVDFEALIDAVAYLAIRATEANGGPIFVEMGVAGVPTVRRIFERAGRPLVEVWPITYYGKKPCALGYAGTRPWTGDDFSGMDDEATPMRAMLSVPAPIRRVLDPCAGRGLTPFTAATMGLASVSVELNPRRLAVAIDKVARFVGAEPIKV